MGVSLGMEVTQRLEVVSGQAGGHLGFRLIQTTLPCKHPVLKDRQDASDVNTSSRVGVGG